MARVCVNLCTDIYDTCTYHTTTHTCIDTSTHVHTYAQAQTPHTYLRTGAHRHRHMQSPLCESELTSQAEVSRVDIKQAGDLRA